MFRLKCSVSSEVTHRVMISREVEGRPTFREVCQEKTRINIGYNDDKGIFKVEDNQMSEYPAIKPIRGESTQIAQDWEILETFFSLHNIEPHWDNCGYVWGWYDPDQGGWTGCMGKVSVSCCQ